MQCIFIFFLDKSSCNKLPSFIDLWLLMLPPILHGCPSVNFITNFSEAERFVDLWISWDFYGMLHGSYPRREHPCVSKIITNRQCQGINPTILGKFIGTTDFYVKIADL